MIPSRRCTEQRTTVEFAISIHFALKNRFRVRLVAVSSDQSSLSCSCFLHQRPTGGDSHGQGDRRHHKSSMQSRIWACWQQTRHRLCKPLECAYTSRDEGTIHSLHCLADQQLCPFGVREVRDPTWHHHESEWQQVPLVLVIGRQTREHRWSRRSVAPAMYSENGVARVDGKLARQVRFEGMSKMCCRKLEIVVVQCLST